MQSNRGRRQFFLYVSPRSSHCYIPICSQAAKNCEAPLNRRDAKSAEVRFRSSLRSSRLCGLRGAAALVAALPRCVSALPLLWQGLCRAVPLRLCVGSTASFKVSQGLARTLALPEIREPGRRCKVRSWPLTRTRTESGLISRERMDAARRGGHRALLFGFEGAVVDDGQAVVSGPGNAIELQLDNEGAAGCPSVLTTAGAKRRMERGKKGSLPSCGVVGMMKTDLGISSGCEALVRAGAGDVAFVSAAGHRKARQNRSAAQSSGFRRSTRDEGFIRRKVAVQDGLGLTRVTMSILNDRVSGSTDTDGALASRLRFKRRTCGN